MKLLREFIEKVCPLSQDEWEQIVSSAEKVSLNKKEIIIQENSRFKKEVFIQSGIVRAFIIDNDGNEKTTAFFRKNDFISTHALRTKNGLSLYTYQALNPVSVITIDIEIFSMLLKQSDKINRLVNEVKGKETLRLNRRDECLLQVRAEEKYIKFRQFYPNIETEIAHHHIASYLGITPVSLSRIRKKLRINKEH